MIRWFKSLQKREMHEAAKNVMVVWSFVCAWTLIVGLAKDADTANVAVRAFARLLTLDFWSTVWAYPIAGLGIIAFVTRPRAAGATNPR